MRRALWRFLRLPVDDYLAALMPFAERLTLGSFAAMVASAVACWWIYVPLHELAHAFGCLLGGGSVTQLDIDAMYGAAFLQRFFPFIHVGSEYAGRLSGFDTGGSDATYLLTDVLPFVATILVGVPLLRAAARPGRTPLSQAIIFGAALPLALAPFGSLTGDYYEMGSIIVSHLTSLLQPDFDLGRWRGDDVFKLLGERFGGGAGSPADVLGMSAAWLLGSLLAWLTYAAGAAWSAGLERLRVRATAADA
ncbi:MAG: hypothetical protein ABI629_01585 [bacterium]